MLHIGPLSNKLPKSIWSNLESFPPYYRTFIRMDEVKETSQETEVRQGEILSFNLTRPWPHWGTLSWCLRDRFHPPAGVFLPLMNCSYHLSTSITALIAPSFSSHNTHPTLPSSSPHWHSLQQRDAASLCTAAQWMWDARVFVYVIVPAIRV